MIPLLLWLGACWRTRLLLPALAVSLLCAGTTDPLTLARYLLAQGLAGTAALLAGPRPPLRPAAALLILALFLDRAQARTWLGQDALFALPALVLLGGFGLSQVRRGRADRLCLFLAGLWLVQGWVDMRGLLAWMRPLPHPVPDALPVPCIAWALALACLSRRPRVVMLAAVLAVPLTAWMPVRPGWWLPGPLPEARLTATRPTGWLLVSNNPEQLTAPGLLLEAESPPGPGRVLVSHINLGPARDLVLEADAPVPVLRLATARDNLWLDAGTLLWERFAGSRGDTSARRWVVPGLRLNGMIMLATETDRPVHWRVYLGDPTPTLARRGPQAAGLFLNPDQRLEGRLDGPAQIRLEGPWLRSSDGQVLAGDYGAVQTFELEVDRPTEVLWKARGGVLDLAPAGSARHLAHWEPGKHRLELSLPANAFAPSTLLFQSSATWTGRAPTSASTPGESPTR